MQFGGGGVSEKESCVLMLNVTKENILLNAPSFCVVYSWSAVDVAYISEKQHVSVL